jgi:trans-aconitate 2-methyltransferase
VTWDPGQYARFSDHRARPLRELLARVPLDSVHRAADLGCGTGEHTRLLCERWPGAEVVGVDNSAEMLSRSDRWAIPGRLRFERGDLATWEPAAPLDLLFSNAVLHWAPDHARLVPRLARRVAPGGALAVQMPGNFGAPSHRLAVEVAGSDRWREPLGDLAERPMAVDPPEAYARLLLDLGFAVDAWETTYLQVLAGEDPVLEWMKGTYLRPFLERLDAASRLGFLDELGSRLRLAYPPTGGTTLFPFRRIFFVGVRT